MSIHRNDVGLVHRKVMMIDHVSTGELMKNNRIAIALSLRDMAARMDISAAYLSDLERGRRNWSEKLVQQWWEAASQE